MKNWRQVDHLDDAEKPETLEHIRTKYGAFKASMRKAKTSIYFKCPKNNCKFQMRWKKKGGALQALHEHNHTMEEISPAAGDQPFQNDMEVWRQVDHLHNVEEPESLEYIREKYGTHKINHNSGNYVYFKSGNLEALREHHHTGPLKSLNLNKLSTSTMTKDATQKEENKKINQPPAVPPIAKNSVPKKKKKPTTGLKKPKKGEMPKKVPFLSHEEARRIMMGFKPTKVSKEDKRGQE